MNTIRLHTISISIVLALPLQALENDNIFRSLLPQQASSLGVRHRQLVKGFAPNTPLRKDVFYCTEYSTLNLLELN